jgi:hypothetical protein
MFKLNTNAHLSHGFNGFFFSGQENKNSNYAGRSFSSQQLRPGASHLAEHSPLDGLEMMPIHQLRPTERDE